MWVGPGGVIAIVLGLWGWVWASRRTGGRPYTSWLGTALAIGALQGAVVLATVQSWLVVGYADAAKALSVSEREVLLDLMGPSYGPLLWGTVGVLIFGLGLARSRSGWESTSARPGPPTLLFGLSQGLLLTLSLASVAAFHLIFVSGGAETVNRQGAAVASQVLLTGSAVAWLAVLLSLLWLGGRALQLARGLRAASV